MVEKQFKKDEVIFPQGIYENSFYWIIEGTVGIFVNYGKEDQHKLTEVSQGEFFGELGLIENYPRSAAAVSLSDGTRVKEIVADELEKYLAEQPDNCVALMKHIGHRLRAVTEDYNEVTALIRERKQTGKETENKGLREKMKKHISVYKANQEPKNAVSIDSQKKKDDGFSKNVESFEKGTVICKEGETGTCMYEVHWGNVGVYTGYGTPDEAKLTELVSGDFFGEMGMLDRAPRSATAVALVDETSIETIYMDDLGELFEKNPQKIDMILSHLSSRLRKLSDSYLSACGELANL